jgi:hypothetical protein
VSPKTPDLPTTANTLANALAQAFSAGQIQPFANTLVSWHGMNPGQPIFFSAF